jgi:hypothetical protein
MRARLRDRAHVGWLRGCVGLRNERSKGTHYPAHVLQQCQDRRRTASHLSRVKALMLEDSVPVKLFDDKLRNLTTRGSRRNSHRHNPSDACVTLRRLGLGAEQTPAPIQQGCHAREAVECADALWYGSIQLV